MHARKVNIKNKAERRQLQKHVFPSDGVRCLFGWTACCSMLRRQQLECRWCSCLRFTCARRWPSRRSRCLTSSKRLRCLFSSPAAFLAGCTSTNSARPQSVGRSRTATTSSHATFTEQRCELSVHRVSAVCLNVACCLTAATDAVSSFSRREEPGAFSSLPRVGRPSLRCTRCPGHSGRHCRRCLVRGLCALRCGQEQTRVRRWGEADRAYASAGDALSERLHHCVATNTPSARRGAVGRGQGGHYLKAAGVRGVH